MTIRLHYDYSNYCGLVLPNPLTLSTFPVGRNQNTRIKPATFSRTLTYTLFTRGLDPTENPNATSEVKGGCFNYFATEAYVIVAFHVRIFFVLLVHPQNKLCIYQFFSRTTTEISIRAKTFACNVNLVRFLSDHDNIKLVKTKPSSAILAKRSSFL